MADERAQQIAKANAARMSAERAKRPGYGPDGWPLKGQELLDFALERFPGPWLLSFSCGKDSLAIWLYLRDKVELKPFYLYWLPGLSFVEEALTYYEEFFGTHIVRLPHPYLYRYLNDFMYQPPERNALLWALELFEFDFQDADHVAAQAWGLPEETLVAIGLRRDDGVDRRRLIQQHGAVGLINRRFCYPIWDWTLDQTAAIIRQSGVRLSREYRHMGRTIAAWDYQYLKPLQEHYPEDFERLKQWFPLADLELFRYEGVGRGKAHA